MAALIWWNINIHTSAVTSSHFCFVFSFLSFRFRLHVASCPCSVHRSMQQRWRQMIFISFCFFVEIKKKSKYARAFFFTLQSVLATRWIQMILGRVWLGHSVSARAHGGQATTSTLFREWLYLCLLLVVVDHVEQTSGTPKHRRNDIKYCFSSFVVFFVVSIKYIYLDVCYNYRRNEMKQESREW